MPAMQSQEPGASLGALSAEHQVILGVAGALEGWAEKASSGEGTPDELAHFVTFIVDYSDVLHHRKEEELLFEAMVAAGFPREAGPIAVMKEEHETGRALTRQLASAAREAGWTEAQRWQVAGAAWQWCSLLRRHIAKEDDVLYPMARRRLSAAALSALAAACEAVDEEHAAAHHRLEQLGLELRLAWAGGR